MEYSDIKKKYLGGSTEDENNKKKKKNASYADIASKYGIGADIDQDYISSFFSDASEFLSSAEKDYKGVGWSNASSSFESRSGTYSDLSERSNAINTWLLSNIDTLDKDAYTQLRDALRYVDDGTRSIYNGFKSAADFYSQFATEDAYNTWYQKEEEEKAVLNSEDFEHYSQMGANIENPTYAQANGSDNFLGWKNPFVKGAEIKNIVTFSRDNADHIEKLLGTSNSNGDLGDVLGDYRYRYLEKDEVAIYNYYLGKGDTQKAAEYLASLDDELNQRHAGEIVERVDNTALELIFSIGAGLDQFVSGVKNLGNYIMGTEGEPTTVTQYANSIMSSNNEGIWKVANDLANTTGNMLPSILVGSFTGGLGGALTLGASATGNAYAEMRTLGYEDWQAAGYATLVGASETALQYIMGGIGSLGGKAIGKLGGKFGANVGKFISGLDNAYARLAIQIPINMGKEALEEGIQTAIEPVFKSWMTGEYEAATLEDILYSALLGGLSAGVMDGAPNIVGTAVRNTQAKKAYGDGSSIVNEALGVATKGSDLEALANKYKGKLDKGKKLSGEQIVHLDEAIKANDPTMIKTATEARLAELGETENVSKIADVLTKQALGKKLSMSEKAILKNSKFAQRVSNELDAGNIQSGEYSSAWAENIGTRRFHPETYNKPLYDLAKNLAGLKEEAESESVAKTIAESETAKGEEIKVSDNGKTLYYDAKTDSTTEVNIKKVVSTKGGIEVELDNGKTVGVKDLRLGSQGEAIMYEMVARMDVTPETANVILNAFKPESAKQASMYFAAVPLAYRYGQINNEAGLKHINLSKAEKRIVFNQGRADAKVADNAKTKTAPKGGTVTAEPKSGIIFEGDLVYDEDTANELQKASMPYIEVIDKMSNVEVHVFESKVVDGKRVATINGRVVPAPNGYFTDGNKVYIDINAGARAEGAMLYTLSHEIGHYIRKWNAKGFRELGDFLIAEYGKHGDNVEALLRKQKEKIKNRRIQDEIANIKSQYEAEGKALPSEEELTEMAKKALPGEAKLADMAYEELVCDAMSDMLADPKAYEKLLKLKKNHFNVWQKLGEAIKAILDKFKTALGVYKTKDPTVAKEAHHVRDFSTEAYNKLQDLYLKAFVEADANYEAAKADGSVDLDGDANVHLFSDKSMVEGAGLQFILNEDGVNYKVLDKDGKSVKKVTAEMIVDSPLGNLVTMAKNEGFLGTGKEATKAAQKQYEFLAELVNMCINYNGIAPIWETAGTMVFSSMKSNADKQYGLTIDFSTVCKKTQAIVDAMSEAMLRLGRGLTRSEVETIYLEVGKAGESTPCPVCYVFSRWMGIGGILDQISRFQDKYSSMSEKSLQQFIADIKQRIDERANTPEKDGSLKKTFFDKKGEIAEGKVIAKLKDEASRKASSALNAISKNSNYQLQIQELETLMKNQTEKDAKKTAKKIAGLKNKLVDVTALEKEMHDANDTLEEYEAYQWLTRTMMMESDGKWVKNSAFKPVPKDILFDLNKGDKFAEGYPLSWAFRTGKGASAGKAIVPYADARVGEAIQAVASQGVKDIKMGIELNPFLNSDTKGRLKILKSAIEKQARQNLVGGQRYQSTSDFRYEYGSDYLITFLEMQAIGAKVQLYTKVIEAVDFLASVGADCNLSVMPLSDGFITLPDGTKKLVYSSVTGIDAEAAIKKSHEYNNVQLILVGISDEHIRLALEGLDVTFVIPFHGSGNSVHQIQALMNLLGENLDVTTAEDYTSVQSDHVSPNQTKEQKAMWNLRVKIIQGKAFPISVAEQALLDKNPYLKDLYRRFYLDKNAEEYGIGLTTGQAEQIFPYEYWDKSLTYAEADKNGERFKEYCASMGIIPRFSGMNSKGEKVGFGDFTNDKGYWKLLIDRPMYDNTYDSNGNWTGYGKYHEQARINCSNFQVKHLDPEYGSATYGDVMSKANDPKKTNKIVDAALKQFENNTLYSDRVLMGSLFSGGGTLEAGLAYQMLDKQFGVEYDGRIASVYADNYGDHIQVGRVEDFDISKYDDIFYLHASPVCHNFSKAKHGAKELQMDIDSAKATAKHLETAMPQVFTVENAPGYRKSQSLKIITDKLTELGYKWDVDVYNSADYGSATSRNRVILRAVKDGELPAKPSKQSRTNSWDKVTKDLWRTLPKAELRHSFISAIENTPNLPILDANGKVNVNKPLLILTTNNGHQVTYCWEGEICPTLTTKCGEARLIMPDGNIYAVTPEFMGRIQGLPNDYKYPKAKTRAFTIIGNGIPTHLTKAVIGGVLDSAYEQTHDGQVLYDDRDSYYEDYSKPITAQDVEVLRSIGRKSINEFTSDDIKKAQKWAYKFYRELGTKSPFFRAWFGDWRAHDKKTKIKFIPLNTGKISAQDVPRNGTINKDTGWKIEVSGKGIDKTSQENGKWSAAFHSLKNIDEMLSKAVLLDTTVINEPSKKIGGNAVLMHSLYCPVSIPGSKGVAKLYVIESYTDTKTFYLTKIEMVSTESGEATINAPSLFSSVDTEMSIAQIFEFVKVYDKYYEENSKNPVYFKPNPVNPLLVNKEDGTPKVFYHGTPNGRFNEFSYDEVGKVGGSQHGYGFYFTESEREAKLYTQGKGHVISAYIKIANPIYAMEKTLSSDMKQIFDRLPQYAKNNLIEEYGDLASAEKYYAQFDNGTMLSILVKEAGMHPEVFNRILLNLGFDGIIYDEEGYEREYVVFKSAQIKSATDNIGTFNRAEENTLYSDRDYSEGLNDGVTTSDAVAKEFADTDIQYSIREEAPPKETKKAYKLMRLVDGKLYPLFIGNNEEVSVGTWYNADSPNLSQLKDLAPGTHLVDMKTGEAMTWDEYAEKHVPLKNGKPARSKPNVDDIHWANDNGYRFMHIEEKAGGKSEGTMLRKYGDTRAYYNWGVNGSSKTESGEGSASLYALRPGWHFGEVPSMHQIGYGGEDGETVRLDNQVWVEVEMSADVDYNAEAEANWSGDIPTHIPTNGYYRYATNPTQKKTKGGNTENDATKADWYVAGAFKVNRIMSDSEADAIVENYNKSTGRNVPLDYRRNYGRVFNAETMRIEDAPKFSERDPDAVSNRTILANALESVAKNDIEKAKLAQYKSKIELIEKEQAKLTEIKAKVKELSFAKGTRDNEAISKLRFEANQIENRINTYDKQLLNLESTSALKGVLEREKSMLRKKLEQKGKQAVKDQRQKDMATIREIMNRNTESRKKAIEGRHKTEMRRKIREFKERMQRNLEHPTDRVYIPAKLAQAIIDVCDLINTDTPLYKEDGSLNKAQERRNKTKERLLMLKVEYDNLKNDPDALLAQEYEEVISKYFEKLRTTYDGRTLMEMSLSELEEMYTVLKSIDATLKEARKTIGWADAQDVYEAGDAIVREQAEIAESRKNGKRNAGQQAKDAVIDLTLSPVRNVERMTGYKEGSFLTKLFHEFERGVRVKNLFIMRAYKLFEALTQSKTYDEAIHKAHGKTYTDSYGRQFSVSKMQMMQTILSYEREAANEMTHIKNGGFTFADLKLLNKGKLREAISEENSHRVNETVAMQMIADFTEALADDRWAQDYMEASRKFFDGMAKDAVNETYLELKHRIIARDKKYIPFETDKNFVVREISAQNDIQQTINSYGMLQETKKGASQPLIISGLNNIVDRHIEQVGSIQGLAIPIRNFNKVWNVRAVETGFGNDPTVKGAIEHNWGVGATNLITQTVQDLQGARPNNQPWLYRKVKSGYITAKFVLNLSVVLKQIGSLFTSTSMLKWRNPISMMGNLVYTMFNTKKISAEVDKYTASVWMRRQGLSDSELHTLMTEAKKPGFLKAMSKTPTIINPTKWITAMDSAVALSLWKYAKEDTAKRTGLTGEELLKATAEFYDSVIENTQSMSDVLHRPEIQKRGDIISESLGMFKTDLYQNAGQLQAVLGRYKANKTKENGAALARTVYGITASTIWGGVLITALMAMLRYKVDPYRDDEDEDLTLESWLNRLGFGFVGELFGYIFPLAGGELVDIVENIMYGEATDDAVDSLALTAINDLISTMTSIGAKLKEGEVPSATDWEKLVTKSLEIFGVPAINITRTIKAMQLHAQDIANGEFLSFEAGAERTAAHHIHRIAEALESGKTDIANGLFNDAVEVLSEDRSEALSKLKTELGKKYKEGEVSKDTTTEMLENLFGMTDDDIYWQFDKWDYAQENGTTDGYSKYDDLVEALESGQDIKAIINEYKSHGVETKTLKSQLTQYYKPLYKEARQSGDSNEMARIRKILYASGLYGSASDVVKTANNWLKD